MLNYCSLLPRVADSSIALSSLNLGATMVTFREESVDKARERKWFPLLGTGLEKMVKKIQITRKMVSRSSKPLTKYISNRLKVWVYSYEDVNENH